MVLFLFICLKYLKNIDIKKYADHLVQGIISRQTTNIHHIINSGGFSFLFYHFYIFNANFERVGPIGYFQTECFLEFCLVED